MNSTFVGYSEISIFNPQTRYFQKKVNLLCFGAGNSDLGFFSVLFFQISSTMGRETSEHMSYVSLQPLNALKWHAISFRSKNKQKLAIFC